MLRLARGCSVFTEMSKIPISYTSVGGAILVVNIVFTVNYQCLCEDCLEAWFYELSSG